MPASSTIAKSTVLSGFLLTIFLLLACVFSPAILKAIGCQLSPMVLFFISRLLFWVSLALIYLYCIKIEGQSLLLWERREYGARFYIMSVIVILIIIYAGSGVLQVISHLFKWNNKSPDLKTLLTYSIPLKLFIVITAAFVEEMIFRAYLMPRLQLFFKSKWWPIIISAIIFGLGHYHYGTFVNVAIPVFIGLVFAWHYQKYRNIKILIICHFAIDFVGLMFLSK